jgi:hypothetical protein
MRAHFVGRIGNLGHAGDIVGQPLVVGLGFSQVLRRGEIRASRCTRVSRNSEFPGMLEL